MSFSAVRRRRAIRLEDGRPARLCSIFRYERGAGHQHPKEAIGIEPTLFIGEAPVHLGRRTLYRAVVLMAACQPQAYRTVSRNVLFLIRQRLRHVSWSRSIQINAFAR